MATGTEIVRIEPAKLLALDAAAQEAHAATREDQGTFSNALRRAEAVRTLRNLLTPEVMAPVMALQGTALGFLTDKDRDGGYPVDVVRDCAIEALARGGRLTGNEMNIVSRRAYMAKAYFLRQLDEKIGRGNWRMVHGTPMIHRGKKSTKEGKEYEGVVGAVLTTTLWWKDSAGEHTQELTHAIKGDDYASADSYAGKADRKCGAWLLRTCTGEAAPDGDADDATTVTPTRVEDLGTAPLAQERRDATRAQTATREPAPAAPAAGEEVKRDSVGKTALL